MENVRKFLPLIIGGVVAIVVLFISRKVSQSSGNNKERAEILEKAREAKLAKSILKKSEEDDSQSIAV
jgi:poly-D-alanine transfer protein DltD